MWVIKLGGSVSEQVTLVKWLQLVARHGDGKVIIVPGGGLYADAVRQFQAMRAVLPDGHVNDKLAHALAVYAMDQMARSFVAMVPELVLVRNPLEIAERGWQHLGLVWLPSEMVLNPELWSNAFAPPAQSQLTQSQLNQPQLAPSLGVQQPHRPLPENWDVTSDSLSAWLAAHLEARQLVLVKSATRLRTPQQSLTLSALQNEGIIDLGMAQALALGEFNCHVMHHRQWPCFEQGFDAAQLSGQLC